MSWSKVKLSDLVEVMHQGINTAADKVGYAPSGMPIIQSKHIKDDGVDFTDVKYLGFDDVEKYKLKYVPKDNDILFSNIGTIGKSAVVKSQIDFMFAWNVFVIRPKHEIVHVSFMKHFLDRLLAINYYEKFLTGGTVKFVNKKVMGEIEIPLPPLEEQKRIATILDKADAIRRKRQQAIKLADEFLRAVFLDMFGDPVTNPKGWNVFKMSEVIEFKGGHQPPKETFEYEPLDGYIRLIQIRDFKTDKYKTYIPKSLAKRSFEEDDVMIARYGPPVFQILRGLSGSYNVALMKAEPKNNITRDFIYWLLQLPAYQEKVVANSDRTAGQTGVNLDLLNNLDVPLPPLEIQSQICRKIKMAESSINKMKLESLNIDNLFFSLSQKAFNDEL